MYSLSAWRNISVPSVEETEVNWCLLRTEWRGSSNLLLVTRLLKSFSAFASHKKYLLNPLVIIVIFLKINNNFKKLIIFIFSTSRNFGSILVLYQRSRIQRGVVFVVFLLDWEFRFISYKISLEASWPLAATWLWAVFTRLLSMQRRQQQRAEKMHLLNKNTKIR